MSDLDADDGSAGKLVLEIGANIKPQAKFVWHHATVETLDADEQFNPTYVADCRAMPEELYGKFDGILASHVLEHVQYSIIHQVLAGWVRCLKMGGELHILVPSFEWAAKQVLSDNPSRALFGHLFGGQTTPWDYHYCMFTMRLLRFAMEKAGCRVTRARSAEYHLRGADGEVTEAEQHYVMGIKVRESDTDPLMLVLMDEGDTNGETQVDTESHKASGSVQGKSQESRDVDQPVREESPQKRVSRKRHHKASG